MSMDTIALVKVLGVEAVVMVAVYVIAVIHEKRNKN